MTRQSVNTATWPDSRQLQHILIDIAEAKRERYEAVVRDEDCATIFQIGEALDAVGDGHFFFGRNEPANQHLHQTIATMTGDR